MAELLATFSLEAILIILCVVIPGIIKGITWVIKTVSAARKKKQELQQQGANELREEQEIETRFSAGENRMTELECEDKKIEAILEKQQKQIDLLIRSDELDIKAWIKQQHEHWTHIGAIDSESLSLVLDRFQVYTNEGGNSWAERMVKDIKALPIVTAIELQDYKKQQH